MTKIKLHNNKYLIFTLLFILILASSCKDEFSLIEDKPLSEMKTPVIKTLKIKNITQKSAEVEAVIEDNGGGRILVSGICWSKEPTPTIEDFKTTKGYMYNKFTNSMQDLSISTVYYVRAYATNIKGTSYGDIIKFQTNSPLAEINTSQATEITDSSVIIGGVITEYESSVSQRGVCYSYLDIPTIESDKVEDTTGDSNFQLTIQGLKAGTRYGFRAYAINSSGVAYGNIIYAITKSEKIKDIDGNSYQTIRIGNQVWTTENLKVSKYRNGDPIYKATTPKEFADSKVPSYGQYDNDESLASIYGNLYTFYAIADARGIAPEGWRVAKFEDYIELASFLGGAAVAGGKMKQTGNEHWNGLNVGATNESGFNALPAGLNGMGGYSFNLGNVAYIWTSSVVESESNVAYMVMLNHDNAGITPSGATMDAALSVRLIKE